MGEDCPTFMLCSPAINFWCETNSTQTKRQTQTNRNNYPLYFLMKSWDRGAGQLKLLLSTNKCLIFNIIHVCETIIPKVCKLYPQLVLNSRTTLRLNTWMDHHYCWFRYRSQYTSKNNYMHELKEKKWYNCTLLITIFMYSCKQLVIILSCHVKSNKMNRDTLIKHKRQFARWDSKLNLEPTFKACLQLQYSQEAK
jgi:hypothetical protein